MLKVFIFSFFFFLSGWPRKEGDLDLFYLHLEETLTSIPCN